MTRYNVILAILTGVLIALGATTAISWVAKEEVARDRQDINHLILHGCINQRTVATVARESLIEMKEENKAFLNKGTIPGYTHKELVELTERKQTREGERILKLDAIATASCQGE